MHGQWIGRYEGTNGGLVVIDLDDEGTHYRGSAVAFDNDPSLASLVATIVTADRSPSQRLELTDLAVIRPGTSSIMTLADFRHEFPDVMVPNKITAELERTEAGLALAWTTDLGTEGHGILEGSRCHLPSELPVQTQISTWEEFKTYVFDLPERQWMFRGQGVSKRLRTSFHRSRRKDLVRYISYFVPEAHRALTARTRHLFDLRLGDQNGAFLNLLQHHGFPTPLLDWSHSPFVAAFFAYRYGGGRSDGEDKVRIFAFDRASWIADCGQFPVLAFSRPHFSILEALSIENPRAIPQQAISSVTNVDDIESYIREMEHTKKKTYLQAIDLPFADRPKVMHELSLMGITAGSLFPGLDGACEELRGRFFHPIY